MFSRITATITHGASDTDKSFSMPLPNVNIRTVVIVVVLPNYTNAVTGTVYYKTDGTKTLWQQAAIAMNASTPYSVKLPLIEDLTVQLVLSGVPGGSGGTAYVHLYADKN